MPLASSDELTSKPSAVLAFHSTQTRSLCAFYLLKHVSRNVCLSKCQWFAIKTLCHFTNGIWVAAYCRTLIAIPDGRSIADWCG